MLSPEVLRAIEILKGINYPLNDAENKTLRPLLDISSQCLLEKLRKSDLIRLRSGKHDTLILSSYELCHPLDQISLCDILIITGEGFKISIENAEDIYTRYGVVGRRLGILNQLACYYLSQIHLTDMCLEK